jgi:hypothetical protein
MATLFEKVWIEEYEEKLRVAAINLSYQIYDSLPNRIKYSLDQNEIEDFRYGIQLDIQIKYKQEIKDIWENGLIKGLDWGLKYVECGIAAHKSGDLTESGKGRLEGYELMRNYFKDMMNIFKK